MYFQGIFSALSLLSLSFFFLPPNNSFKNPPQGEASKST
jgi:hypothetical protein